MLETFGIEKSPTHENRRTRQKASRYAPDGDHPQFEFVPTDLSNDGGVRAIWTARHRRAVLPRFFVARANGIQMRIVQQCPF